MSLNSSQYTKYIAPIALVIVMLYSACVTRHSTSPKRRGVDTVLRSDTNNTLPTDSSEQSVDTTARQVSTDTLSPSLDSPIHIDSLSSAPDSIFTDSVLGAKDLSEIPVDSALRTKTTEPSPLDGIDDIVEYKAQDSIVMIGTNLAYLFGPSTVDYKDKGLEANFMRMNVDSNLVYAHYVLDSLGKPTAHPKFKDGNETYEAKSMNYNFKTSKGFITGVVTQQGEGFVVAEKTKRVEDNCFFMQDGRYSTCSNHEHPHFYLKLTKAKARTGKNIVAGPSYLVVLGVPLPIGLPFGFFPFTSSYSSGILMPKYGEETQRGFYLREGGYYWAINDYIDLSVTGDWYSRGSWGVNVSSKYSKRYRFNGGINLSYIVTKTGDEDVIGDFSSNKDFRISWHHSQDAKANPNQTFSASVNFSTSSYNHNSLNTLYNPLVSGQNTKSSSINYSRTFAGTPWRLSASIDASQTSATQQVTLTSPNLSVSMGRIFPFKRKKRVGAERWYEKIGLSYSGQLRNSITTHEDKLFKSNLIKDWKNGISHNIPISASYKLFDYIDLTLSANYTERWYSYKTVRSYDASGDSIARRREYGFNRVADFSTSANMNTTLYGFFKPWKLFGNKVQMIRHRMTPSIGVSYRPDFSEEIWGIYRTLRYTNKRGNPIEQKYSLYEEGIFGAPGPGKSASINFSLDNNIEAKYRTVVDSVETFKKFSLIDNFSISTSYNLAADSFQLADIYARINLKLSRSFNLNLSGAFDPYMYGHTVLPDGSIRERRINKLRILNGKGFGALRGTGTSFSYTFNNETFKKIARLFSRKKNKEDGDKPDAENNEDTSPRSRQMGDTSLGNMAARSGSMYSSGDDTQYDEDGYAKFTIPWNLSVSYGVNLNRTTFDPKRDEYNYGLTHNLMFSGSIQPTKNWSFNFNASYDFEAKRIANMTVGISRDLHCWSLTASAIPFGPYKSYNLTIGVKSSMLRDLKYDKHSYPTASTWY